MEEKKKNKKPFIFILLAFVLCLIVGGTIAYYSSSDTFNNEFASSSYGVTVTEKFESPDNWTPGTTTDKLVNVKNNGDTPVAVRIKLEESWKDDNGDPLPVRDTQDNLAAIINYGDGYEYYWIQGNYEETTNSIYQEYYYYKNLDKNATTENLIEAVTFNPEVNIDSDNDCVVTNGRKKCTTTYSGYAGATYTLKITVETTQYDKYAEIWGTDIDINYDIETPEKIHTLAQRNAVLDNTSSKYVSSENGINFTQNSGNTNGKGVYIRSGTENDNYPITYYRGNVNNNNVLLDNTCWKMVRTTDTGGTKLISNGSALSFYKGLRKKDYTITDNTNNAYEYDGALTAWTAKKTDSNLTDLSFKVPAGDDYVVNVMMSTAFIGMGSSSGGTVNVLKNNNGVYGNGNGGGYIMSYEYDFGTLTSDDVITIRFSGSAYPNNPIILYVQMYHTGSETFDTCAPVLDTVPNKGYYKVSSLDSWSPEQIAYMTGKGYSLQSGNVNSYANKYFGSDFVYEGDSYRLVNPKLAYDTEHRYTCYSDSENGECEQIYYYTGLYFYIRFNEGDGINTFYHNTNSSNIKGALDSWYSSKFTSYTDLLEDTIWCNDRTGNITLYGTYNAYDRVVEGTPSLTCSKNDGFTVSNESGNKALTYKFGVLTSDELMLAGLTTGTNNPNNYLNTGYYYWTMTPKRYDKDNYGVVYAVDPNGKIEDDMRVLNSTLGMRPAISLKNDIMISKGNGTYANPYVVQSN